MSETPNESRLETPQEMTDRLIQKALQTQQASKALSIKIAKLLETEKPETAAAVIAVRLVDHYHKTFFPQEYALATSVALTYDLKKEKNS